MRQALCTKPRAEQASSAANAPIFSYDVFFGGAIVGGPFCCR